MIRLIRIELKKLFKRKEVLALFPIIILASFLIVFLYNKKDNIDYNIETEKMSIIIEEEYDGLSYENYKKELDKFNDEVDENIKILNYSEEEKQELHLKEKFIMEKSYIVLTFLGLALAVIGCSIVSSEINNRSIKELITKPFKRWKFITSKYIAILISTIIFSLTLLLSMTLLILLITKTNVFELKELVFINDKIVSVNYFIEFIKTFCIYLVPLIFISSFSIFLSTVISSTSLSTTIVIVLSLTSTLIFQLLFRLKLKFIEYTFLPYMDLTIYNNILDKFSINSAFGVNLNITSGIIILLIYSIIFFLLSNFIFSKKDIVNN